MSLSRMLSKATLAAVALVAITAAVPANAQSATEIQLSYKDKKFDPAEISAPANTPIVIKLKKSRAVTSFSTNIMRRSPVAHWS